MKTWYFMRRTGSVSSKHGDRVVDDAQDSHSLTHALPDYRMESDSFRFWGAAFGPLWLLSKTPKFGLIAIAILVGFIGAITGLGYAIGMDENGIAIMNIVAQLGIATIFGLEGGSILIYCLRRSGFEICDVIVSRNALSAETEFVDRWYAACRQPEASDALHNGPVVE